MLLSMVIELREAHETEAGVRVGKGEWGHTQAMVGVGVQTQCSRSLLKGFKQAS